MAMKLPAPQGPLFTAASTSGSESIRAVRAFTTARWVA